MTKRRALPQLTLAGVLVLAEAELISGPLRSPPLRAAVALPLALYLPGSMLRYALIRRPSDTMADHIVTALGLSVAVLAVGGVVLNLFAFGLRPITWLAYLAVVILIAGLGALGRGDDTDVERVRIRRIPSRYLLVGCTIVLVVLAAFAVAIVGAHRQRFPGFAQFWLIRPRGGTDYQLGVASYTGQVDSYDVRLDVDKRSVRNWHFKLSSGRQWSVSVRLPARVSARATLYRNGAATPYREVFIQQTAA